MGYRKLLKDYIEHVQTIIGTDLIDVANYTQSLTPRARGELRLLVSELHRDPDREAPPGHNARLSAALAEGSLSLATVREMSEYLPDFTQERLSDEEFEQLLTLLARMQNETRDAELRI